MKEKIIGILGGMGPEATIDLANKIIQCTHVTKEQDHCRIIIDNNPGIENRTEAILSGNTGRVISQLSETAVNLEKAGADFIIIPCNTAHYFLEQIRQAVNIEVLDMIEETALFISRKYPRAEKAGILGTSATCRTELYHKALSAKNISVITPDDPDQEKVMTAIALIKEENGHRRAGIILAGAAEKLINNGAEMVIAACTEVPLALKPSDIDAPLIDPSKILAARAVEAVKGKAKDF